MVGLGVTHEDRERLGRGTSKLVMVGLGVTHEDRERLRRGTSNSKLGAIGVAHRGQLVVNITHTGWGM